VLTDFDEPSKCTSTMLAGCASKVAVPSNHAARHILPNGVDLVLYGPCPEDGADAD
jgi:hypothetical protein